MTARSFWSIAESPVDEIILAPPTEPPLSILNETVMAIPEFPAERASRRRIAERTFASQAAFDTDEDEKEPALLRDAAVRSDC
ncbi:hypothetical protein D3C80_421270 [compost metagenome]|nr:Uncharacterised protein [Agrobacterium tumefaciens]